jgi:hypothetical protein
MSTLRWSLAFLLAPLVPVGVYCLPGVVLGAGFDGLSAILAIGCIVAYAHAILLGIPIAVVLFRMRRLSLAHVLGAAFLIGAVPFAAWTLYTEVTMPPGISYVSNLEMLRVDGQLTRKGWVSIIDSIVMTGLLGMVTGLTWWWISGSSANNPLQPTRGVAER